MNGVLVVVVVVLVIWGGLAVLIAQGRREYRKTESELARVRALSPSDAKQRARELLHGSNGWQVRPATSPATVTLPPAVADMLGEYEEVANGEFWIGRSALSEPARIHGFTKIGEDVECGQLMVAATGMEVFSSYEDGEQKEAPEASPTVWHRLLEAAEVKV